MSLIQVGLADTTGTIDLPTLHQVADALNVQVMRDLTKYWDISATVRALPDSNSIPVGVWPVLIVDNLPSGEGGFHLTDMNQPFARVEATDDLDQWTVAASHEVLEMLVDPSGNKFQIANAIQVNSAGTDVEDAPGQFQYLVELGDPCEADQFAYQINGVAVSDFITPNFYDATATSGTVYSFKQNITRPRQVLPGGYISFVDPMKNVVEQIKFFGNGPQLFVLGSAAGQRSLREFVDGKTAAETKKHRGRNEPLSRACLSHRQMHDSAATINAKCYRHK